MHIAANDDVFWRGNEANRLSIAHTRKSCARCGRRAAGILFLTAAALVWLSACTADKRVTLAELEQLEQAATQTETVPVEHQELALTEIKPYRVVPGDVLSIRMFGLLEDRYAATTLDLRVHDDGTILPPVVGPIKLAGLTLSEVDQALIAAHVPKVVKDLSVFVQLANAESTTVLVQGAAAAPGLVKLNQNQRNTLYALASAGGFATTSSGRVHLRPIRPEREEITYNLNDVNDVRRALLASPLESGDILTVDAADTPAVFVSGLVNAPGPVAVPPQSTLSVQQAIAAAGGLREYLDVKEATLVRMLPTGERVQAKLDLRNMLAGLTPDFALKSGDILRVSHTPDTMFQEWFVRNILVGPFSVGVRYDPLAQYNASRALENPQLRSSIQQSLGSTIPSLLVPPVPAP